MANLFGKVRVRDGFGGSSSVMLIACRGRPLNPDAGYATFRRARIPDEILDGDPRCGVRPAQPVPA